MKILFLTPEERLCRFIVAVVLCIFSTNVLAGLSNIIGVDHNVVTMILKSILAVMFLLRLNLIVKRLDFGLVVFVTLSFVFVGVNYIVFPELNEFLIHTCLDFYAVCLTTFVVCYVLNNYELLMSGLTKASYFITVTMFLILICRFTGILSSFNDDKYSMGLGYSCLIPSILLTRKALQRKSLTNFLCVAVLAISVITFGSRGPLLALALFFSYFGLRYQILKRNYAYAVFIVISILVFLFSYKFLLRIYGVHLSSIDMQTRVISTTVENEDGIYLSGRDELYEQLLYSVRQHPFVIRGINAEWAMIGGYAHNIVIELIYQFGVVVGGGAVFFIMYLVWKTLTLKVLNVQETMCVIFMFSSIPQLMFSSSLWTNYVFWMWIAVLAKTLNKQNSFSKTRKTLVHDMKYTENH